MAAPIIKVTPSNMVAWAGQFGTEAGKVRELSERLRRTVLEMEGRWYGTASVGFAAAWPLFQKQLDDLARSLETLGGQLVLTAGELAEADQRAAANFGGGA